MSRIAKLARIACAALACAACAPPQPVPRDEAPLVWPAPPAAPRIAFVRAVSRPDDLGIRKGLIERFAELLFGGAEAQFVRPIAVIAVGASLYVADPGAKGVHRLDAQAGRYALIRAAGGAALPSPVALAAGADGEVYVSDSALGRVLVLRPGADTAVPLELAARLRQPTGIAYDPAARRLIVVDTAAHRIHFFNADGSLAASSGRRGAGDGEFNYPTLLWRARDGRLYVTDSLNFRVQELDPRGAFVAKFGRPGDAPGDAARQKGVATDRHGHVYVVDSLFAAMQIFDAAGRFLLSVGELGSGRGEFWLPAGIFISEDDHIYVADAYNRRIQILRYVGGAT